MIRVLLSLCCVVAVLGAPALAQTDLERFERLLEEIRRDTRYRVDPTIPAEQRAVFDIGGHVTFNYLSLDDSADKNHGLRQTDLSLYGRANFDGVHDFFIRARASYRDFNSGDSFDGKGDEWVDPIIDRAIYRFDLARAFQVHQGQDLPGNIVVQAGRQLVHWANGLVLSEDLDGGLVTFSYDRLALTVVAGVTRHDIIDFDSSRPDFDDHTHRGFYGAMLQVQVTPRHRPYIYGLIQEDYNERGPFGIDPDGPGGLAPVPTRFEYNSFYIGFGSTGSITDRLAYSVEVVFEGGETTSNSINLTTGLPMAQTVDDISAAAADFRLDYLFQDAHHTRLSGEFILATGDSDRTVTSTTFLGNKPNTKDRAFNAAGLVNTGLAFAPPVSNVLIVRLGASTFPLPQSKHFSAMQVGLDLFVLNKFDRNAPIDEFTTDSGYLGIEADLYVNWRILSDLSLALRYGAFFPGDAIPSDRVRNFFYAGLTYAF